MRGRLGLLVVGPLLLGCGQKGTSCPGAGIDKVAGSEGSVTWVMGAQSFQSPLAVPPATGSTCAAWFHGGGLFDADGKTVLSLSGSIDCASGPAALHLGLSVPGDLRTFAVGESRVVDSASLGYVDPCRAAQTCTDSACGAFLSTGQVVVRAVERVGGPVRYPGVVSPDFRITFEITITMASPLFGGRGEHFALQCADSVAMNGSFRLTVTSREIHAYPNRKCVDG